MEVDDLLKMLDAESIRLVARRLCENKGLDPDIYALDPYEQEARYLIALYRGAERWHEAQAATHTEDR